MCSAHYQRFRIHGKTDVNLRDDAKKRAEAFKPCSVQGCDRDASNKAHGREGMCSMHYRRYKKHGDPNHRWKQDSPAVDWLVAHIGYDGDDCLIWPFSRDKRDGYGRVHRIGKGVVTTASNYMCELAHGPSPEGRDQCAHSCGKGHDGCVNPKHLRWATTAENQADRLIHGTDNRGPKQGRSRLAIKDVREIRKLASEMSQYAIAKQYAVHQSHINKIIKRKTWAWLP
jgi:hypothetical protein